MTEASEGATALGAVVLAAGASRRFGTNDKLLAPVGGEPLLRRVVRAVLDGGISYVVVVSGAGYAAHRAALEGLDVSVIENSRWSEGMGGSIATGVRSLPDDIAGTFIVPGDMPNLSAQVIQRLAATFHAHGDQTLVVPVTRAGKQRNPVFWPRRHFDKLAGLSGEAGAKSILASLAHERINEVFDDAVLADIDTRGDYERYVAKLDSDRPDAGGS